MAELPTQLPNPKDPQAVAEYMLVHGDRISAIRSWLTSAARTLSDEVKRNGRITTRYGVWGVTTDVGWEYPPEIADRYPEFGKQKVQFEVDTTEQVERVLSVLLEDVPDLSHRIRNTFKAETIVDGKAVLEFIQKSQDAETVQALKALRKPKEKYGKVA